MELRRRRGGAYMSLWPGASRDPIRIVAQESLEDALWLGSIDRAVARQLANPQAVLLDIEAWRLDLLDSYRWLPAYQFVVGVRLEGGVAAVIDNRKPLIRRQKSGEADPLGRQVQAPNESACPPWYERTL